MASAPSQQQSLPLFYKDLAPLNADQHKDFRVKPSESAMFLVDQHAVPLAIDEFVQCQRHLPIVFSTGENPIPLALMALNEGMNTLVDGEGKLRDREGYMPAYVRRYPWMLARLDPAREELSLCFDPTYENIGLFEDGDKLIHDDGAPTAMTREILTFCEQFEQSARRTGQFMTDLVETGLLMEGELSIAPPGSSQPFLFRGFQMVNEEKLRELRGDQLRKYNQNGMLPLIFAHLFSLQRMTDIFQRQLELGLGPVEALLQPA
jgi:hypothetical protein